MINAAFGRGGQLQARVLEFVTQPQKCPYDQARAQRSSGESLQVLAVNEQERGGSQGEAHGVKEKRGDVLERILDQNEGRAPQEGHSNQEQVGLARARH